VRVGIIGAGIMGHAHAGVVNDYHRSRVVAVASGSLASAEALATTCPGARSYADYEQLLADPAVDLVCIAVPDHRHADVVGVAAQAGKHIIVEKPFTTDVAGADRALRAVRQAGVKAMTLFNHRWVPAYAQAQERIAAGEIGAPVLGYARKNDWIYVPTEMLDWAASTTAAWFLSSHDLDLLCWWFDDEAVEVYATAVTRVLRARGIDTPDAIQAQVRFRGGAVATVEACWIYPNTFPTMTDSFMEVIGTDGVIHLDRKREQIEIATHQAFSYPRNLLMANLHGRQYGAVRNAICHVIDCVLDDQEPLVTLESSRHVTAILAAMHESLASGQPARVAPAREEA
jgi:predicted dehydrogenase